MDFLDPIKKRKNRRKLFIGYLLVAIAIGLATLILIFLSYGYSLDRKSGTVIQNGIVFVNSRPGDAEVYFNNQRLNDTTDARAVLPSDQYNLQIRKDGYRTWQRDFYLAGGTIERLVYPVLFPNNIETSDIETYKTRPTLASQSPDRRWLVVQRQAATAEFELYDLNQTPLAPKKITIPASVLSKGTRSFTAVEWSNNNRHLLLRHAFGKSAEFIMLDRENPQQSFNITTLTKGSFNTMTLRDKKFDQWYLHNTSKQQLFLATRAVPKPQLLIDNVIEYKSHGTDVILYATNQRATKGKTRIVIWDEGRGDVLREVVASKRYLLDVARFDNQWYFVAGGQADGKVYVYRDPFEALRASSAETLIPATIMRLQNPQFVSFSQNTRFIAVQAGGEFAVYDAETERAFRYDTKLAFKNEQKAMWMDGHRLTGVVDGQVRVFDYDGINIQSLVAADQGYQPFFSGDYETLFTIAPKAKSTEANLTQSGLIID